MEPEILPDIPEEEDLKPEEEPPIMAADEIIPPDPEEGAFLWVFLLKNQALQPTPAPRISAGSGKESNSAEKPTPETSKSPPKAELRLQKNRNTKRTTLYRI